MLAEPRHEPKVRQGVTTELIGVDGNAYAPFPKHDDLLDFAVLNGGLDGRPDIAFDWSTVAEYLARYDGAASVNVAYVVGNSPLRIAAHRLGRGRGRRPDARRPAGEAARGDGGRGVRAVDRARLPAGRLRDDGRAGRAGRGERQARRLLPHARALPAGRRVPRPVPGGDRDRAARRLARPHHALLPPGDVPGPAGADARARRRCAGRGPRRLVRPLPLRVVEHAPADHAADVDPGRRRRAAEGAAGRSRGSRQDPRRDDGARPPVRGRPLVGRAAPRCVHAPGAPRLGGPHARRRHARDRARPGRHDLRPAPRRGPAA